MKKLNEITIEVSYETPSLVAMDVPNGVGAGDTVSVFFSHYHMGEEGSPDDPEDIADLGDSGVGEE